MRAYLLFCVTLCVATAAGFDVDSFTSGTILSSLGDVEAWLSTHPTAVLAWLRPQDVPGFNETAAKLKEGANLYFNGKMNLRMLTIFKLS